MAAKTNPWDRQPGPKNNPSRGESEEAFEAFSLYLHLGPKRSIEAVHQEITKNTRLLKKWSSRWRWVERARAWDCLLQSQKLKEAEKHARKQEARRLQEADEGYDLAQLGRAKLREMLKLPIVQVVTEYYDDGRPKTIVAPTKWSYRDVAALMKGTTDLIEIATSIEPRSDAEIEDTAATVADAPRRATFVEVEEVRRADGPPPPAPEPKSNA